MKKFFLNSAIIISILIICTISINAQMRIAVLPFQNMDGDMQLNIWSYKLQDSLTKALIALDPDEKYYRIVPADSVEDILAQFNLDPTNPQYPSDMWKAVALLDAKIVASGNFNVRAKRFLINAYLYDVRTKLPDPVYQARDIFKKEAAIMESIPMIIESIKPALIPENK